jgi:hypothetical protein
MTVDKPVCVKIAPQRREVVMGKQKNEMKKIHRKKAAKRKAKEKAVRAEVAAKKKK